MKIEWKKNRIINNYLINYHFILMIMIIISANIYYSIQICNSNMFGYNGFNMKLSKYEINIFNKYKYYDIYLLIIPINIIIIIYFNDYKYLYKYQYHIFIREIIIYYLLNYWQIQQQIILNINYPLIYNFNSGRK